MLPGVSGAQKKRPDWARLSALPYQQMSWVPFPFEQGGAV